MVYLHTSQPSRDGALQTETHSNLYLSRERNIQGKTRVCTRLTQRVCITYTESAFTIFFLDGA